MLVRYNAHTHAHTYDYFTRGYLSFLFHIFLYAMGSGDGAITNLKHVIIIRKKIVLINRACK